ncbi:MAG: hypothetical protein AAF514_14295 [Verrucomicrobiota bacterium]
MFFRFFLILIFCEAEVIAQQLELVDSIEGDFYEMTPKTYLDGESEKIVYGLDLEGGILEVKILDPDENELERVMIPDVEGLPQNLTYVDGGFYFTARGFLWRCTLSGQKPFAVHESNSIQPSRVTRQGQFHKLGSEILFYVNLSDGFQLWATESRRKRSVQLADLGPLETAVPGGERFYFPQNRESGPELWETDGTTRGTRMVWKFEAGSPKFLVQAATEEAVLLDNWDSEGPLYVFRPGDDSLVRVDGSEYSTRRFPFFVLGEGFLCRARPKDDFSKQLFLFISFDEPVAREVRLDPPVENLGISFTAEQPGRSIVMARDFTVGNEIWEFRNETLTLLKDVNLGMVDGVSPVFSGGHLTARPMERVGGTIYYTGDDGQMGSELYRIDPGRAPELAFDLSAGVNSSGPRSFYELNGVLYFSAVGRLSPGRAFYSLVHQPFVDPDSLSIGWGRVNGQEILQIEGPSGLPLRLFRRKDLQAWEGHGEVFELESGRVLELEMPRDRRKDFFRIGW